MTVDADVVEELRAREPAGMVAEDYWEVGASGRIYDRAFVLGVLAERHAAPVEEDWDVRDLAVRPLGAGVHRCTYALRLGASVTRRATVWRRDRGTWRPVPPGHARPHERRLIIAGRGRGA